jgi:hypothetical protein
MQVGSFSMGAFFGGEVTKATRGPVSEGQVTYFSATDSGMPGGTFDTFRLDNPPQDRPPGFSHACLSANFGALITEGNIVIKTTEP